MSKEPSLYMGEFLEYRKRSTNAKKAYDYYIEGRVRSSRELEKTKKELAIYKEMLINTISELQGDFDLYRVGKIIQEQLEERLGELQ